MTDRDERIQFAIARAARRWDRRTFLRRAAGGTAGALATLIIGDVRGKSDAFASTSPPCNPPNQTFCFGCGADSSCPSGYITCTVSTPFQDGCCPYTSGWWYTANAVGNRHRCRDCTTQFGARFCTGTPQGLGFCGCRSTIHY